MAQLISGPPEKTTTKEVWCITTKLSIKAI